MDWLTQLLGINVEKKKPLDDYLTNPDEDIRPSFGGGINADGSMSAAQAPATQQVQMNNVPQAPAPQQAPQEYYPEQPEPVVNNNEVAISGDPWKPHHRTTLGTIADVLLGAPVFGNKAKRDNMREAMKGFTDDPLRSIRRVAKFNPEAAWEMFNVYEDNRRADDISKRSEDTMVWNRVSGLLSVANQKNYSAVRDRARAYAQRHKLDIDIPDSYDPEEIESIRQAGMSAKEQLTLEANTDYREERLRQFEANITSQIESRKRDDERADRNTDSMIADRDARRGMTADSKAEQARHNRAMEGKTNPKLGVINTKYGPMELSPDGRFGRIKVDGKEYKYGKVAEGQWRMIK